MVKVAGLVLVRQRPGTAWAFALSLLKMKPALRTWLCLKSCLISTRKEILRSRLLMVEGRLQREGDVTHVIVRSCHNLSSLLQDMTASDEGQSSLLTLARADEKDGAFPVHDNRSKKGKVVQVED